MKIKYLSMLTSLALLLSAVVSASAQGSSNGKQASAASNVASATAPIAITSATSPLDLARAALAAQGGDKFRQMKSLVLIGSVDLFPPNSAQSVPGNFVIVTAGDRLRIEIKAPMANLNFRQIYDGQQSYSSIPGVQLPSPGKFGLNVLTRFDQPGYTVTALPDKKKQRAFRIADAEGNATDFYIDPANGRVMTYLIQYNGYTFGVENTTLKEVEGVLVPYKFTQRLEMPQGAFFAEYKVKTVNVNKPLGDDVFTIPTQ